MSEYHYHAAPPVTAKKSFPWWLVMLVVVSLAGIGIFLRLQHSSELKDKVAESAVPNVVVIPAKSGPAVEEVVLPGSVEAWHDAPIYARTSGYLKKWYYDIGTFVKAGTVLAEIDAPEVDAALQQAQADLKTAEANNQLAQTTAQRWRDLLKTDSITKQEADERIGDAAAKAAGYASARANAKRLTDLASFKRMVAPFDGVITARNTDTGALINAGTGTPSQELFHISQIDQLRIYVQVPQNYAQAIQPDLTAELHFSEHPGQVFEAKLAHTAKALDPVNRSLLIELNADNPNGQLLAGGYAEVHLKLPSSADHVQLPVNTLVFRADGLQVATVDADGNAQLKPIKIARDYGTYVEVDSGIAPDETIIVNPPDSLLSGQKVKIVQPSEKDDAKGGSHGGPAGSPQTPAAEKKAP